MKLFELKEILVDPLSIGSLWIKLNQIHPDYELIVSPEHLIFKYQSPENVFYVHRPGAGKEISKICVYQRKLRKGEKL